LSDLTLPCVAIWASRLQRIEDNTVSSGSRSQIGADGVPRHGDASVESLGRGKRLHHRRGLGPSGVAVSALQLRHRPRKLAHREHRDVVGECNKLGTGPGLEISGKGSHRRRRACPRQSGWPARSTIEKAIVRSWPRLWGRFPQGREPVRRSRSRTEGVVVNDDGCHLGRGQFGIVELPNESLMIFRAEGLARGVPGVRLAKENHPHRPGRPRSLDRRDRVPNDVALPPGPTSARSTRRETQSERP